jgi:hypothetical protein
MRTVGVAPGTYTLQLGAPMTFAPNSWQLDQPVRPCPPDEISSGAWGVPTWNWYGYTLPMITMSQQAQAQAAMPQPLNPYGTQSMLKGFGAVLPPRAAPTSLLVPVPVNPLPTSNVDMTPLWQRWYVIVPAALAGLYVASKLFKRQPAKP